MINMINSAFIVMILFGILFLVCLISYLIEKLESKEKKDILDNVIATLYNSMPLVNDSNIIYGFNCAIERVKQMKLEKEENSYCDINHGEEQNNE